MWGSPCVSKRRLCSRGLPLPDFPVSGYGAEFSCEPKLVTGPFYPSAVVTWASVEAGKCLLRLASKLCAPVLGQAGGGLPGGAVLASFGLLPGSCHGLPRELGILAHPFLDCAYPQKADCGRVSLVALALSPSPWYFIKVGKSTGELRIRWIP